MKKLTVIITGTTGMVGEGVLHECLHHPEVESVLIITRITAGKSHPKLKELIVPDLADLSEIKEKLSGYNSCFFCAGVTSVGKSEEEYRKITYDLTLSFARTVLDLNPGMTFSYISGEGTDSSEQGRLMWARVKGKTENDLLKLGFADAYMFRPGIIIPTKGLSNTLKPYKILSPLLPVIRKLFPKHVVTLQELGLAMINTALEKQDLKVLECGDIKIASQKY